MNKMQEAAMERRYLKKYLGPQLKYLLPLNKKIQTSRCDVSTRRKTIYRWFSNSIEG